MLERVRRAGQVSWAAVGIALFVAILGLIVWYFRVILPPLLLAGAIVDYRTENGPFASVDDLENVSGIGPATLEEIRDQVTV